MNYVIYTKDRYGGDARYWSGGFRANGDPTSTDMMENAIKFRTAKEAYEIAGMHETLADWYVGKRG